MKIIDNHVFLQLAAADGLRPDPRYDEPRTLNYQNDQWLAIPLPTDHLQRQKAIFSAFDLFTPDTPIWVWRRGGKWRNSKDDQGVRGHMDLALAWMMERADIGDGAEVTLLCDAGDRGFLYGLVFLNSFAACNTSSDLFLVPQGQGFVVYLDHDEQIILSFQNETVKAAVSEKFFATLRRLGVPTYDD